MALTVRFTKTNIEALPPAKPGRRDYYSDPNTKALSLRLAVSPTGNKSWLVQRRVNGRPRNFTLGSYPAISPDSARKKAAELLTDIAHGKTPEAKRAEQSAERLTLRTALESLLNDRDLSPQTVRQYRQCCQSALKDWMDRPLTDISREMVAERHANISKKPGPRSNDRAAYANVVMRTLRSVWNHAASAYTDSRGESLLPPNPVDRLSSTRAWNKVKRRRTYIHAEQMPAWLNAVETLRAQPPRTMPNTVGDYLLFLLLTGFRRNEAATLPWADVEMTDRTVTLRDTKNDQDHIVPMSDALFDLLSARRAADPAGVFVFPSDRGQGPIVEPRRYVKEVIAESGVDFVLHDLRRTFCTVAESLDMSHYALKRLMNHKMTGDVTAGYIGGNVERLRQPMQAITDVFMSRHPAAQPSTKVTSITGATNRV